MTVRMVPNFWRIFEIILFRSEFLIQGLRNVLLTHSNVFLRFPAGVFSYIAKGKVEVFTLNFCVKNRRLSFE